MKYKTCSQATLMEKLEEYKKCREYEGIVICDDMADEIIKEILEGSELKLDQLEKDDIQLVASSVDEQTAATLAEKKGYLDCAIALHEKIGSPALVLEGLYSKIAEKRRLDASRYNDIAKRTEGKCSADDLKNAANDAGGWGYKKLSEELMVEASYQAFEEGDLFRAQSYAMCAGLNARSNRLNKLMEIAEAERMEPERQRLISENPELDPGLSYVEVINELHKKESIAAEREGDIEMAAHLARSGGDYNRSMSLIKKAVGLKIANGGFQRAYEIAHRYSESYGYEVHDLMGILGIKIIPITDP